MKFISFVDFLEKSFKFELKSFFTLSVYENKSMTVSKNKIFSTNNGFSLIGHSGRAVYVVMFQIQVETEA